MKDINKIPLNKKLKKLFKETTLFEGKETLERLNNLGKPTKLEKIWIISDQSSKFSSFNVNKYGKLE